MFRLLPGDSSQRIRLLGKFVEKDYEKIIKILELRKNYKLKVNAVDGEIGTEKSALSPSEQSEMADEWLSRRLDAGLFSLQAIDVVLAWLAAEDDGAKSQIKKSMGVGFVEIRKTLEGAWRHVLMMLLTLLIVATEQLENASGQEDDEAASLRDMLSTLAEFI